MVILAEGRFSPLESKTANQTIRYLSHEVVGVIDSEQAGRTAQQVLGFGGEIPVFRNLESSLAVKPNILLIGIAPTGGHLLEAWRSVVKEAIESKLDVISGLHTVFSEDGELAALAARKGVKLIDLRKVPPEYNVIAKGTWKSRRAKTILTVGTDCNVGKMTAALELHRELLRRGRHSRFVATGQTGILIAGGGVAVDHLLSDYIAGAIEKEVNAAAVQSNEFIVVEGQGAITHQGYSSVTMGLMHGVMPDAMILVHHPIRSKDDYGFSLDNVNQIIELHERLLAPFKPSKVVGIAVNTMMMTADQIAGAICNLERQTGLPAADVLTPDVGKLADAVERHLVQITDKHEPSQNIPR
jgi:uncharacterized NAD-dependent epimerase/dehydratase family protein